MMDLRKTLIELIRGAYVSDPPHTYKATAGDTADAVLADVLLANGVVVREKGEWEVGGHCNHKPCRIRHADKWTIYRCSKCGYSNGRKKSANFCPNCGADMRKGENDGGL